MSVNWCNCAGYIPKPELFTPQVCPPDQIECDTPKVIECPNCEEINAITSNYCCCCGAPLVVASPCPVPCYHPLLELFKSNPAFSSVDCVDDAAIDFYLHQTECFINECKFGCKTDLAKMYLAAHFLGLGQLQATESQSRFERALTGAEVKRPRYEGKGIAGLALDATFFGQHLLRVIIPSVMPTSMMGL